MSDEPKGGISRRAALKALSLLPIAAAWDFSDPQLARAAEVFSSDVVSPTAPAYVPKFFAPKEWKTVGMLADYIIPADDVSGSATDAKVPEYMDWLMADSETSRNSRVSMRGGLAWLDRESFERYRKPFVNATDTQRRQILDEIAWPAKAKPEMSQGVAFFSRFRDLTASGFFSSEMGYKDVRYVGNVFNPNWNGCPPEAMKKLGVSHDLMKTRVKVEG